MYIENSITVKQLTVSSECTVLHMSFNVYGVHSYEKPPNNSHTFECDARLKREMNKCLKHCNK